MFKKFLTTPERSKWVLSEKKSGKCIFCEIVKGNEKIPEMKIYENDFAMVLMNMYPYNSGHIMVVPKKHNENLEDLNDEELSELFKIVRKSIKLLKKSLKAEGFNFGANIGGKVAGGSIKHLHVHIVPRFEGELGFIDIISETKAIPETVEQTYKRIMKNVDILK
jgi:ATP adenylyltransferase